MIDLHSHTYYSDGRYSPAELVEAAQRIGINILSITDHDNTRGSREAAPLARAAGIELIHGVEFTTRWPGAEPAPDEVYLDVDLLGYFMDPANAELLAFEEAALNDVHARTADCCRRLAEQGFPLDMTDIFAQNPRYGGAVQLIQALLAKGYAKDWDDGARMMDRLWLTGRETPFTIKSVIEQLHLAGGLAVLAHPVAVRPRGQMLDAAYLRELVDAGLDGIEIYHPRLDASARKHFLGLAQKFGLLVTGGSDLHGWAHSFDNFGKQPVTLEMVEKMRQKIRHGH